MAQMTQVDPKRLELGQILREILGSDNVYFQPPEDFKMDYDCIRYERSGYDIDYADDLAYAVRKEYTITIIYKDPDSDLPDRLIARFPTIRYNRNYKSDNLNHDVFILFY